MDQGATDAAIQEYYTHQFDEAARLTTRSAQGVLEFTRVQEILAEYLRPSSRVLDVGGGTGVHAAALAREGHEVVLIDPVESQVAVAAQHGTFTARVGDARRLAFRDNSFDAVLLFGPLYHLHARHDRLETLGEAARVVEPGGIVFAAGIPRLGRHAVLSSQGLPVDGLLEAGAPTAGSRFPGGHFHTSDELQQELVDAGLTDVEVIGIEGPAGLGLEKIDADDELLAAALVVARRTGRLPGVRDLSNHILAMGRVPIPDGGPTLQPRDSH